MNPLNAKVIENQLIKTAQVGIPSHISVNNTNGVHCPHGHSLAPRSSYISFRLAASLPNTHSWGLYISQQDVNDVATALEDSGWKTSDSTEDAERLVTAGLTSIFHLDCTLMNLHEILFLQFGPMAYQNALLDLHLAVMWELLNLHAANGIIHKQNSFTGNDEDWYTLHQHLGINSHPSNRDSLHFARCVMSDIISRNLRFSSQEAMRRFILNMPIYNNQKSFPGVELPITIIP